MSDERSRPTVNGETAPRENPFSTAHDTVTDHSVGTLSHIVGGGLR